MAENIKKFFKKKKADLKFKKAGPGQRLCDDTPRPSTAAQNSQPSLERAEMSEEAKQAAAAAMARLQSSTVVPSGLWVCPCAFYFILNFYIRLTNYRFSGPSFSHKQVKAEVKRELSSNRVAKGFDEQPGTPPRTTKEYEPSQYAADGVYFRCPLLSKYA